MNSNDFYKLLSIKSKEILSPLADDDKIYWYKTDFDGREYAITDEHVENVEKIIAYLDNTKESEEDISETFNLYNGLTYLLDITDFEFDSSKEYYWIDDDNVKHGISFEQAKNYVINGENRLLLSTDENVVDTIYTESDTRRMIDLDFNKQYINLGNTISFDDLNEGQNSYVYEDGNYISTVVFTSKDVIYDDGNYFLPVDEDKNVTSVTINGNPIPFSSEILRTFLYDIDSFNIDVADVASGTVKVIGQQQEEVKTITTDDLVTINGKIYFKSEELLNNCSLEINDTNAGSLNLSGSLISLDHMSDYLESEFVVGFYGGDEMECSLDNFIVIDKITYLFIENEKNIQKIQYGVTTTEEHTIYFSDKRIKIRIDTEEQNQSIPYDWGYVVIEPIHPLDLYPSKEWNSAYRVQYIQSLDSWKEEHAYQCSAEPQIYSPESYSYCTSVLRKGIIPTYIGESSRPPLRIYRANYSYDSEEDVYVISSIVDIGPSSFRSGGTLCRNLYDKPVAPIDALFNIHCSYKSSWLWCFDFGFLPQLFRGFSISNGKKVIQIISCGGRSACGGLPPEPCGTMRRNVWFQDPTAKIQHAWGLYQSFCEGQRKETKLLQRYMVMDKCFQSSWNLTKVFYKQEPIEGSDCFYFKTYHLNGKVDVNGEIMYFLEPGGGFVSVASEKWMCVRKDVPKPGEDDDECPPDEDCACYLAVFMLYHSCSASRTGHVSNDYDWKYVAEDVTEEVINNRFYPQNHTYHIYPERFVTPVENRSSCYNVKGREYRKEYIGRIEAKGSKSAWDAFYNNFHKLSYTSTKLNCNSSECPCDEYATDSIPVGVTNKDNPVIDLPRNVGKKYAGGSVVILHETSGGVTYESGTIDDNGNVIGIPPKFTSQYEYNGYMYYIITYCKKDDFFKYLGFDDDEESEENGGEI